MINRANQTLDKQAAADIQEANRAIRQLKQKQVLGADNIPVLLSNVAAASFTLAAGQTHYHRFNFVSVLKKLYTSELAPIVFVDADNVATNVYPDGSSLTAGQLKLTRYWEYDWYHSDETGAGNKAYNYQLTNNDSSSHTYYLYVGILYQQGAAA